MTKIVMLYFQWKHQYDKSGNVINVDFGIGNSRKDFEFGDRIASIAQNVVRYDMNGRQNARHNLTFIYNDFSQLVQIKNGDSVSTKFYYDGQSRLCLHVCVKNSEVLTYFYGREDQHHLITQVHSTKWGMKKLQVKLFNLQTCKCVPYVSIVCSFVRNQLSFNFSAHTLENSNSTQLFPSLNSRLTQAGQAIIIVE